MEIEDFVRHVPHNGWMRLYHAPKDVREPERLVLETPDYLPVSRGLESLHRAYRTDFEAWSAAEIDWWRGVVERLMPDSGNVREAAMAAYERWPAGPASREDMVGLFRKYWFACEAASLELPESKRMWPEDFLLGGCSATEDATRYLVVTAMPYWPMGLDSNGQWC